jgi:hypothetical protein
MSSKDKETLAERDIGKLTGWHSNAPIRKEQ